MLSVVGRIAFLFALVAFVAPAPSSAWADDETKKTEQSADQDHGDDADHGDDHGHADDGTPVLLQEDIGASVVNLAIFLGVLAILSKFVWPVILDGLKARESKIFGELEAAGKSQAIY